MNVYYLYMYFLSYQMNKKRYMISLIIVIGYITLNTNEEILATIFTCRIRPWYFHDRNASFFFF